MQSIFNMYKMSIFYLKHFCLFFSMSFYVSERCALSRLPDFSLFLSQTSPIALIFPFCTTFLVFLLLLVSVYFRVFFVSLLKRNISAFHTAFNYISSNISCRFGYLICFANDICIVRNCVLSPFIHNASYWIAAAIFMKVFTGYVLCECETGYHAEL